MIDEGVVAFFKFMAEWGAWDILGLLVAIVPAALVLIYLFPRRAIDNLYVDTKVESVNLTYPIVVSVELRNHTNEPLYVLSQGFVFGSAIRSSPYGAKDAATGVYEVKFEGRQQGILSDIDVLVRPNQVIKTWIPVHPDHSPESIADALTAHRVGHLRLKVQKISARPHPFTLLKIPV